MTQSKSARGSKLTMIGCAAVALGFLPIALWLFIAPQTSPPKNSDTTSVWPILLAAWGLCTLAVAAFLQIFVLRDELEQKLHLLSENQSKVTERSENLLRMNNHRIKNSLQLVSSVINLHVRELEDPKLRSSLSDLRYRVFALSAIHDELFEGDGDDDVALNPILTKVVPALVSALNGGVQGPSLELIFDPITLDTERALPVCFLVTEMITCAHQLAAPLDESFETYALSMVEKPAGHLNIDLNAHLQSKGPQPPNVLNQKILAALSQQLGGTHDFIMDGGTLAIKIRFPLEPKKEGLA